MLTDHDSTLELLAIPDAILPAQCQSRHRCRLDGVLRLMFAVLMDAVRCWQRGAPADSPSKMCIYLEAGEWIFATRGDSPFCFGAICDVLGIDGDRLRRDLLLSRGFAPTNARKTHVGANRGAPARENLHHGESLAEREGFEPSVSQGFLWAEFVPSLAHYSARRKASVLERNLFA